MNAAQPTRPVRAVVRLHPDTVERLAARTAALVAQQLGRSQPAGQQRPKRLTAAEVAAWWGLHRAAGSTSTPTSSARSASPPGSAHACASTPTRSPGDWLAHHARARNEHRTRPFMTRTASPDIPDKRGLALSPKRS